jgi:hypothetical protein
VIGGGVAFGSRLAQDWEGSAPISLFLETGGTRSVQLKCPVLGADGDPCVKNRAGGIRTHGLHVPNVALYQAEPQPVEKKRRLDRPKGEVNLGFPHPLNRGALDSLQRNKPPITSHLSPITSHGEAFNAAWYAS